MDKLDLVLDMVWHPEKYSPEEIAMHLSDPEVKAIYAVIVKTASAANSTESDIAPGELDNEWERFEKRHFAADKSAGCHRPVLLKWFGSRAAVIAVLAVSSLVAVALGLGINHAMSVNDGGTATEAGSDDTASAVESSMTGGDVTPAAADSVAVAVEPVVFENATLETILGEIARANGMTVRFVSPKTRHLRLYFKWTPAQPLNETVAQLDNFEQIDIRINGAVIEVK